MACEATLGRNCRPNDFEAEADGLYENLGDGTFAKHTSFTHSHQGKGLAVTCFDADGDRRPDIFVANDTTSNLFFNNQTEANGKIQLTECGVPNGIAFGQNGRPQACMGLSIADVNHDGAVDVLVANYEFEPNALYLNYGGAFRESAALFQLASASWQRFGWGAQFADINNDTFPDLMVLNSHLYDRPMSTDVFINQNGETFVGLEDVTHTFGRKSMGRANAVCDWDRNGKSDFVVSQLDEPADLFLNKSAIDRSHSFKIVGRQTTRDARHATCYAVSESGQRHRIAGPYESGYLTTNSGIVHVPPGYDLEVEWPDGRKSRALVEENTETQIVVETQPIRD